MADERDALCWWGGRCLKRRQLIISSLYLGRYHSFLESWTEEIHRSHMNDMYHIHRSVMGRAGPIVAALIAMNTVPVCMDTICLNL